MTDKKANIRRILARHLACLLVVFFSSESVLAQNREFETLVNQVYMRIVPGNFSYYNLIDSSETIDHRLRQFERNELESLVQQHPDFPASYFIQQVKLDTTRISWRDYHLRNARVYSYAQIPRFPLGTRITRIMPFRASKAERDIIVGTKEYNEIFVPVKARWSKKRIQRKCKKAWARYDKSVRKENKVYFYFSKPVISPDGKYAIIGLNRSGGGAIHIFKKVEDQWMEIFVTGRWVS